MKKILVTIAAVWTWLAAFAAGGDVTLEQSGNNFTIRNDYVSVYINANGEITSFIRYKNNDRNSDNSVQLVSGTNSKGYFSFASNGSETGYSIANVYVKQQTADVAEVQYVTNYSNGLRWVIEYIVCRDVPGVYNYVQIEGSDAAKSLSEARMCFRGGADIFNYAYVNDDLQAAMPTPAQMTESKNGGADGGYTEKLADATFRLADGTTYTKYNYATFQKDDHMHGMLGNQVGVWTISPSMEWLNGGVMRQDLTVHATDSSPVLLRHFHGSHFGGVGAQFGSGKKKLYGPHLLYVNLSTNADPAAAHNEMIADAKARTAAERAAFPNYSWLRDTNIKQRGKVTGQLNIADADYFNTNKLQVILAQPGSKPMLQGDGYQFWAETDEDGSFTIDKVRTGTYTLYAYALNGSATGYFTLDDVEVSNGATTHLGTLTWTPDKYGRILWQIGQANHLSSGYKLSGAPRQYALWEEVPTEVNYTIGESSETTDWYYAQAHNGNWYIHFNLNRIPTQPLRLTVATAGAANVSMKVRANENTSTYGVGIGDDASGVFRLQHDGSVTRGSTLAGRDSLAVFYIPASKLKRGSNYLNLNVWNIPGDGAGGVMYDCIKLELHADDVALVEQGISATSRWSFGQYAADKFLLEGATGGKAIDYSGLALHVYDTHTIQAKTITLTQTETVAGVAYSGKVPAVFFNGGKGTVSGNGYDALSTSNNVDGLAVDVATAGTFYALVHTPAAERSLTFNFNGTNDATNHVISANTTQLLSYHAAKGGTIYLKPTSDGSFYLVSAAFVPDEAKAMTKTVTLSAAGYATFSAAQHYSLPEGLSAYAVSAVSTTEATLTPVTVIPAGTGVVLKAGEGSYVLTSAESVAETGTNYMQPNMAAYQLPEQNGTNYNYTLAAGPQFKHSTGNGLLAAGKAFLSTPVNAPKESAAPGLTLVFTDNESTAIREVSFSAQGTSAADGQIYTLSGQRVKQAVKGVYIVNGKKTVIK